MPCRRVNPHQIQNNHQCLHSVYGLNVIACPNKSSHLMEIVYRKLDIRKMLYRFFWIGMFP